jgi:hypothetical protein
MRMKSLETSCATPTRHKFKFYASQNEWFMVYSDAQLTFNSYICLLYWYFGTLRHLE